jgi:hypothetical protein
MIAFIIFRPLVQTELVEAQMDRLQTTQRLTRGERT